MQLWVSGILAILRVLISQSTEDIILCRVQELTLSPYLLSCSAIFCLHNDDSSPTAPPTVDVEANGEPQRFLPEETFARWACYFKKFFSMQPVWKTLNFVLILFSLSQIPSAVGRCAVGWNLQEAGESGYDWAAAHFLLPAVGHAPDVSHPHLQIRYMANSYVLFKFFSFPFHIECFAFCIVRFVLPLSHVMFRYVPTHHGCRQPVAKAGGDWGGKLLYSGRA